MTLILGSSGQDVGDLHQLLLEAGEQVDAGELRSAVFGPSTKTAVLDFQSSHVDPKGRPLAQDGIVGPITLASLKNPREPVESFIAQGWRGELTKAPNHEAMAACAVAIAEVGTKEDPPGSNRGTRVDMYCGKDWLGSPWCMLFISFCWNRAPNGSPFGTLASALKIKNWGAQHGKLLSADDAVLPGDIGIILRAQGRGHVGLATSTEWDGKVSFVEGNNGNACRATVRERNAFSHYVRPIR